LNHKARKHHETPETCRGRRRNAVRIGRTRDPSNPALSVQGGSQSSRGAEFTASVSPAPAWRLDANAAYTDAQFDES